MKAVYLCGPINQRTDADCIGWRTLARETLHAGGRTVVDPMARDYRGREAENVDAIVEGDKDDIDGCDTLLVYYDQPSVGTSMEVLYAWERTKLIVVVNRSSKPLSPWLAYHATVVLDDLPRALEYILAPKAVVHRTGRRAEMVRA